MNQTTRRRLAAIATIGLLALSTAWVSCSTSSSHEETDAPTQSSTNASDQRPPASSDTSGDADTREQPSTHSDAGSKQSGRRGTLWYRIAFEDDHLAIRLRLLAPPESSTLFFPTAERQSDQHTPLRNIELETVSGPDGPLQHTFTERAGKLSVQSDNVEWLEVAYSLPTPEPVNDVRWVDPATSLLVPSRSISKPIHDIPVELHIPQAWRSASTWTLHTNETSTSNPERRVVGYLANDLSAVRDAFLTAGPDLRRFQSGRDADSVATAVDSSLATDPARTLHERVTKLTDIFRQTFGHIGPLTAFLRTGVPFDGNHIGSGRRGGFVLEVPPSEPTGPRATTLLAHETLHTWIGHHLIPENDQNLDWFIEGMTDYLAVTLAVRHDMLSVDEGRRQLAESLGSYHARATASESTTTTTATRDRAPYDRGVVMGLAVDTTLADARDSANTRETAWTAVVQRLLSNLDIADGQKLTRNHVKSALMHIADGRGDRDKVESLWSALNRNDWSLPVSRIAARAGMTLDGAPSPDAAGAPWPFDD